MRAKQLKQQTTLKEPVRIRFKELRNGNKSIYLDIYTHGERRYEFLKLYLVPETDLTTKAQNAAILSAAVAIKSHRIIELAHTTSSSSNYPLVQSGTTLHEWMLIYLSKEQMNASKGTVENVKRTMKMLTLYGDNILMNDIDKEYCLNFLSFMRDTYEIRMRTIKAGAIRHLDSGTVMLYWKIFKAILNSAVRNAVISTNPAYLLDRQEKPKGHESRRTYLTIPELKSMIDTPADNLIVKGAFLFSCFSGLRISDILCLSWKMIREEDNGGKSIEMMMKKTKELLYLPLSNRAIQYLPKKGASHTSTVFYGLPSKVSICRHLDKWAKRAGIEKKVTFHVARHTFATMSLTLGTDIYTTSKLLGHTNVKTTQIYAKIIDKKKEEAMARFDRLF